MLRKNRLSKKGIVVLAMVLFFGAICFGSTNSAIAGSPCEGNFDGDGDVDGSDLATFAADFGRTDCPPSSSPAPVAKTGKTMSYATGDDGNLEKGVAWPNPRFTDNEDGTVTDNLTGLVWLKNANCFGKKNWTDALNDCNGLADGQCGLNDSSNAGDWRLPNVKELHSLIHYGVGLPALPNTAGTGKWSEGDPFSLVEYSWYWTSTGYTYNDAWALSLSIGHVSTYSKSINLYVWCVRGGQ